MLDCESVGVVFTVLPGVDVVLDNVARARDFLVSSKEGYFEPGVRAVVGAIMLGIV